MASRRNSALGIVILLSLAVAASATVVGIVVAAFIDLNNQIDRCDDPSSGTYITDDAERERVCRNKQNETISH